MGSYQFPYRARCTISAFNGLSGSTVSMPIVIQELRCTRSPGTRIEIKDALLI